MKIIRGQCNPTIKGNSESSARRIRLHSEVEQVRRRTGTSHYQTRSEKSSRREFLSNALTVAGGVGVYSWGAGPLLSTPAMGAEKAIGKRRILVDSDVKNEIDDQFAIVRALIAPELEVEGLTAAGFAGQGASAQRSFDEAQKLLGLMKLDGKVPLALGSAFTLKDKKTPDETAAAELIIERAMAVPDAPLYVVAIGQATNLASALLMEPKIADRVVFVLIGGSYHANKEPAWGVHDYNWGRKWKDIAVIFESKVPVLHVPASGVTNRMILTRDEVKQHVAGRGPVYDYLASLWDTPMVKGKSRWVMWDIAPIHQVIDPLHGTTIEIPAPTVHDDGSVGEPVHRDRKIEVLTDLNPQTIFNRFWRDIEAAT